MVVSVKFCQYSRMTIRFVEVRHRAMKTVLDSLRIVLTRFLALFIDPAGLTKIISHILRALPLLETTWHIKAMSIMVWDDFRFLG